QRHYFLFPRRQACVTISDGGRARVGRAPSVVTFDRGRDGVDHVLIAKRLWQKVDSASFHRTDRHGDVAMARNQDNGQMNAKSIASRLEIESADAGQPNIENDATRRVIFATVKKLPNRGISAHIEADSREK